MKQITLPNGWLMMEVPEDYWSFHIDKDNYINAYPKDGGGGTKPIGWFNELLPGKWEIIGKASELSEDYWKDIVEITIFYDLNVSWVEYKDYGGKENWSTAKLSGYSLLANNSMNPETTLILKQTSNQLKQ